MAVSTAERAGATALRRVELSRPVRLALEHGVIRPGDAVFDYGCGHGHDIDFLAELGYPADGWDPHHRPNADRRPAAIANLGYVLNVIADPADRCFALKEAWRLATRALIVAVRTSDEAKFILHPSDHSDGVLTGIETFQKLYGQAEARAFIDEVLDVESIPLAPGGDDRGVDASIRPRRVAIEWQWIEAGLGSL